MRKLFVIVVAAVLLTSCVKVLLHDENKAAAEAGEFLRILFLESNFEKAYQKLSEESRNVTNPAGLQKITGMMKENIGNLKELQLDSFSPVPGQKAINIFYNGIKEKGLCYFRVFLTGDASSGYKVSGFFVANQPYPPKMYPRRKFNKSVIIN